MSLDRNLLGGCAAIAIIAAGLSWSYWLRDIAFDMNKTPLAERPGLERLRMKMPSGIFVLWERHAELYPKSKSRTYASLSLIAFFVILILAAIISLLVFTS